MNRTKCNQAFFLEILFLLIFSFACEDTQHQEASSSISAEFEKQESIILSWDSAYQEPLSKLIRLIASYDKVSLFYNSRYQDFEALKTTLLEAEVNLNNVEFASFDLQNQNVWIRDYGPIFFKNQSNKIDKILSFNYEHESNQDYNSFGSQYANKYGLSHEKSKLYSAGGGREINGKGTMVLVESYEKYTNPNLSVSEIENEYKKRMKQKNIIWLKEGLPQDESFDNGPVFENIYGNGVNGHIDEFCRFANDSTILLAKVDPSDYQRDRFYHFVHKRLEESFKILSEAKDQDGKDFNIVRVPQAPIIFTQGTHMGKEIFYTTVTSYLNFTITNSLVIVPSCYSKGDPDFIKQKDLEAKKILEKVFKNRMVVLASALDFNYGGGGFHCVTLHKPL